jgi:hypothetical protein
MKHTPHLFTMPLLLEAKEAFFGPNARISRHRRNVLMRMAFSNAFLPRATKTNIASVLNKNHATIIHYTKGHEWHLKYFPEYTDLYNLAKEIFRKYDIPKISEKEFNGIDNTALLNQLVELKDKLHKKDVVIKKQEKELNTLRVYYRNAEQARKLFPSI